MHVDNLPDVDADLAAPLAREIDEVSGTTDNRFSITYYYVDIVRLPPPYPAKCMIYAGMDHKIEDQYSCLDVCIINATIAKLRKVPFTQVVTERYDLHHVTVSDIRNQTFWNALYALEQECTEKCKRPDCRNIFMATDVASSAFRTFRLIVNVPNEPSYDIEFLPGFTFLSVLIYITSSVSTWLGLSIVGMNPVDLFLMGAKFMKSFRKREEPMHTKSVLGSRVARLPHYTYDRRIVGKLVFKNPITLRRNNINYLN